MTATAKREGSWWCEQDYRLLFEAIACVMTDEQIAEHTERRVSAVRARAHILVKLWGIQEYVVGAVAARGREPDFDCDSLVRMVHQHEGIPYWDTASDLALTTGWGATDPPQMQQLCDQLGIDEDRIAQRCLKLELARTRAEVVDRFGADEHGDLYQGGCSSGQRRPDSTLAKFADTTAHRSSHRSWSNRRSRDRLLARFAETGHATAHVVASRHLRRLGPPLLGPALR